MALLQSFLSAEQFQCSICLDIFTNPVSTPCGHSFCMACIGRYWDESRTCQCPLCKEIFRNRPDLHINRTLREITEQFKVAAGFGARSHSRRVSCASLPKPDELASVVFAEARSRWTPSHSQVADSYILPALAPPVPDEAQELLVQASGSRLALRRFTLGGSDCLHTTLNQKHQQCVELFCKNDKMCTCEGCAEMNHADHDVIFSEREGLLNKSLLGITNKEIQEMIQDRVKKVEEIRTSLMDIKESTETEMLGSLQVFSTLVSAIQRSQAELLEIIEMNHQVAERQVVGLIQELEDEIEELQRRGDTLKQLLPSEDNDFLLETKDWSSISVNPDICVVKVHKIVSRLVERFQEELKRLPEISLRATADSSSLTSQPKARKIQEYAVDVRLDASTAHPRLILSEDRKQVCCGTKTQKVPDFPQRFNRIFCVLGQEGFTSGRHYWEVEVRGKTDWDLGVASQSVNRKGKITVHPSHGFWFLSLRDKSNYGFQTSSSSSHLRPQKIGVFLDYDRGQVSFYNVEAKLHIYTFHGTFSDTIYPFFCPCSNKSGKNEAPLIITPIVMTE
ncbi:E3 ubiquitin-protein ligase TRIM39 [Paramormyrops kingsleyae]|uniref:Nuclear factor 7, brain-like n=1 Tax=Paramormyrops kingsleyae TaxID=1676925 RepID=A0A3B3SVH4_9TELE|nr:nuclear factor 7, brain-like [Paramormyrops kingsleyae]XP_023692203.1 nuclear factor 7, brain-like [Paramormyrops kingsleyae]XP_023692205.1 nuclear factor 7, brain-like [Paramormyrops kingsleyae]XP_023692206.1 nuclear factor 7, brain-like [Paramormyrops kingsleyae]